MAPSTIVNNQKSFGSSFGEKLGEHLGSGLSSGLQQLANQKLERIQKKNAIHELRMAIPDLPDEALPFLASRPAKELNQLLEQYGNQKREQEEQQLMAMQQQQQQMQSQAQQEEEIPDEHFTPEVIQHIQEQLQSPEAQQQFPPEQLQQAQQNLMKMQERLANNPVGVNPFPQEQGGVAQLQQQPTAPVAPVAPVQQAPASKGGIPVSTFGKSNKDALAREKQDLAREKFEFEKQQAKGKTGPESKKEKTVAEEKLEAEVTVGYQTLKNLHKIAKRMLSDLDTGEVTVGPLASIKSKVAPTYLNDVSGEFNKDSNRIVNLESQGLRGAMSKYRVQKVEAAKPSLDQSVNVNKTILRDIVEETEDKLEGMKTDYPDITKNVDSASKKAERRREEAKAAEDNPLEYPAYYEENTQYEDDDGEKFILKNGEWRPM